MQKIIRYCLILILSPVAGVASAQSDPGVAVAERYGIGAWDEIQTLEFTFNAQSPDKDTPSSRSWVWDVAGGNVTRTVDGKAVEIGLEADIDQQTDAWKAVHKQFINDSYWFLFPFQLVWSNPQITDDGAQPLPIGNGVGTKLICQWPDAGEGGGGYTPGDAYDLYLGDDGLIQQWVFRRGGKAGGGGGGHTWEDHQQLGPIVVSLDHHGPKGAQGKGFRLWFTDVQATLTDGTVVAPTAMDEP